MAEPARRWGLLDRVFDPWAAGMLGVIALHLGRTALRPASLWRDDAWVALVRRAPFGSVMRMGVTAPGFGLALRVWFSIVGFSELRAQLPAYTAFLLAPALLYLLGRRIGLGRPVAGLAAVLLLTSAPFVGVAARVKPYSFDALAGVIVLWLAWDVVEAPESNRRWLRLAAGAAVLTAISSAVVGTVIAAFAVALVAAAGAGAIVRRRVIAAVAVYGVFAAGWWLIFISKAQTRPLRVSFGGAMIPGKPGQSRFAGGYARLSDLVSHFTPLAAHHATAALMLLGAAIAIGSARRPQLTLLLVIPLVVSVALAVAKLAPLGGGGPITVNGSRIDVHLYPALALLFAVGVAELLSAAAEARLLHPQASTVVAVVVLVGLVLTSRSSTYPQEDTKGLIRQAEQEVRPGDLLVVQADARYQFGLYSRAPVHIVFSDRFENGFTVATSEPGVLIMGGGTTEDGNSDSAVFGLVKVPKPPPPVNPRVIVVSSAFYSTPAGVDAWLTSGGYHQQVSERTEGAVLQVWDLQ